jgi:hypothetical protein
MLIKHEISSFFPLLGPIFGLSGSRFVGPIESEYDPDAKHCTIIFFSVFLTQFLFTTPMPCADRFTDSVRRH